MAKQRNLSDPEIGIVKAMLRKGWRNDVIHFYFNKPDRLISSGRITQIKKAKYGASVEEAPPEELEAFLAAWEDPEAKPPSGPLPGRHADSPLHVRPRNRNMAIGRRRDRSHRMQG